MKNACIVGWVFVGGFACIVTGGGSGESWGDGDVDMDVDADVDGDVDSDVDGDDLDGDGWPAPEDCDDGDPAVHPGATEGDWEIRTIEAVAANGAAYVSNAIGPDGVGHVAYQNVPNQDLVYATDETGEWIVTVVDQPGYVGKYVALAVDSEGSAHAVYAQGGGGLSYGLKYATRTPAGAWTSSQVTLSVGSVMPEGCSVMLVEGGGVQVEVAFRDFSSDQLVTAGGAAGTWSWSSVRHGSAPSGIHPTLVRASSGERHVVHAGLGELLYDRQIGGMVWVHVGSLGDAHSSGKSHLVVDDGDVLQLVYLGPSRDVLVAGVDEDGYLADGIQTVAGPGQASRPRIAVDGSGSLHVVWSDGALQYAVRRNGDWEVETLDTSSPIGDPSIAIGEGTIRIAYPAADGVREARRSEPDGIDQDCDGVIW